MSIESPLRLYPDARGSSLRRTVRDFFSHGGRHALTVRVTEGSAALANLSEHDWQLLVVDPTVVDLPEAYSLCVQHRAFLVCDAVDGVLPAGLGSNAAAYFPPLARRSGGRPCAPAVAGVFARIDNERGVWKAPAGTEATLRGALSRELTSVEIEGLAARNVNALRTLPTVGAVVSGAVTATDDPEWKYVPVRRLVLFLERSIDQGLRWPVFEPNDEPLWADVRCDRSTMTQADIEAGRLVVLVGVAPVRPAEFVTLRIEIQTGGDTSPSGPDAS